MQKPLVLAALAAVCHSAAVTTAAASSQHQQQQQPTCRDFMIPVDISAEVTQLPSDLNVTQLTAAFLNDALAKLATAESGGRYEISARYCEPAVHVASRADTLQLLVHGITYTKTYWSGLADPATGQAGPPDADEYSWLLYASQHGYPTLSIDRLCNGASSRPNGLLACQLPLQAETMRAIIQAARNGSLSDGSGSSSSSSIPKFGRVVLVGHSYGSLVAAGLAVQHPTDSASDGGTADALVLTGFSAQLLYGEAGVTAEPAWQPAALVEPERFASDDPAYIIATRPAGALELFYYGDYDPAVADYDYAHRQTVTLGELATVTFGQLRAPAYTGPVYVENGDHDTVFCETSALSPVLAQHGNCAGLDQHVKTAIFPAARAFAFANAPSTGHCLGLHRTAQASMKNAHDWLASVGF